MTDVRHILADMNETLCQWPDCQIESAQDRHSAHTTDLRSKYTKHLSLSANSQKILFPIWFCPSPVGRTATHILKQSTHAERKAKKKQRLNDLPVGKWDTKSPKKKPKKNIFVGKKRALTWIWMLSLISTFVIVNFFFVTHFYDGTLSSCCCWCCCGPLLLFHTKKLRLCFFFSPSE